MSNLIKWNELVVTDVEGDVVGTLGEVMDYCPANLDSATIKGGAIVAWPEYFLSLPETEATHEIPAADWDGFESQLMALSGN